MTKILAVSSLEKNIIYCNASWNAICSKDYRKALNLCGSKSGRDCDKDKEAGLTPYYTDGTTAYKEADLIFVCRKLYAQEMKPECFTVDGPDEKWYPGKDYHTMYMGEIVKVLVRE